MRIKKTENLTELVDRIQDWYKLNCNGDWEHSYGYSIATIDNPGWTIRIDLSETPLENLEFNEEYQNKEKEHDWFFIKNKEKVLNFFPALVALASFIETGKIFEARSFWRAAKAFSASTIPEVFFPLISRAVYSYTGI